MKYLLFLLILCYFKVNAQMIYVKEKTSGYMGKRFCFGAHLSLGPSSQFQKASEVSSDRSLSLNKDIHLSLQYAINNKIVLKGIGGKLRTSASMGGIVGRSGYNEKIIFIDAEGNENEINSVSGTPKIEDRFYGIEIKTFPRNRGGLAPIGSYFGLGLNAHSISVDVSQLKFYANAEDRFGNIENKTYHILMPTSKKVLPEITLSAGYSRPLFNFLILDFGVKMGYLHPFTSESYNQGIERLEERLESSVYKRMRNRQFLNYTFGIMLPF